MRFSPVLFNRQLADMGQRFAWRRSALCPCREPTTGGADPSCAVCHGKGVSWGRVTVAHAGVVGAKAARAFAAWAKWEDGDVLLSVPAASPMWHAGESDRMAMLDGHMPFSIILDRDEFARIDFPVVAVERCYWKKDDALVDAALPQIDPATKRLTWADMDLAPPFGAQFTVSGTKRPEYFLYKDIPVSRSHFQGQALPKRLLLKRFDLFGRGAAD